MWKIEVGKRMKTAESRAFVVMGGMVGGICLHAGMATSFPAGALTYTGGRDNVLNMAAMLVSTLGQAS
jgi:hypothetical protein